MLFRSSHRRFGGAYCSRWISGALMMVGFGSPSKSSMATRSDLSLNVTAAANRSSVSNPDASPLPSAPVNAAYPVGFKPAKKSRFPTKFSAVLIEPDQPAKISSSISLFTDIAIVFTWRVLSIALILAVGFQGDLFPLNRFPSDTCNTHNDICSIDAALWPSHEPNVFETSRRSGVPMVFCCSSPG